jgi:hypothetical protein
VNNQRLFRNCFLRTAAVRHLNPIPFEAAAQMELELAERCGTSVKAILPEPRSVKKQFPVSSYQ